MSRMSLGIAIGAASVLCLGGPVVVSSAALFNTDLKEGTAAQRVSCGTTTVPTVGRVNSSVKVAGFNAEQIGNATIIVQVGVTMKVPPRGWVIAVATAMQESSLVNLGHLGDRNDHDSQGLFQQRPSQGWGSVAQVRDPKHASGKFYEALLKVDGWQNLPLTVAAQRVQRSAYPNAYAKHEAKAGQLVDAITDGAAQTPVTAVAAGRCAAPDEVTSTGWVRPVKAGVVSGFRTAERPDHDGVDLGASRGTPIKAVAAGTVIHLECDQAREIGYDCNRDGSPSTPGCGWYVDISHKVDRTVYVTRYCHMLRQPEVKVGGKVTAGQRIGVVGTSGHSSGPHLHFEVMQGRRGGTYVDPVKFMRARGAPLGGGSKG